MPTLNHLEKPIGCPFDGEIPTIDSFRAGCRDEPYRVVKLSCPKCGIQLVRPVTDSSAVDDAIRDIGKKHKLPYDRSCMVWAAPDLVKRWNTRV